MKSKQQAAGGQCLLLAARMAARDITRHYDCFLKKVGIRTTQFSLLQALEMAGPVSYSDLQEAMVLNQTTLSRNVKPLIRDGYVKAEPSPEDGRVKLLSLTDEGRELAEKAFPLWNMAQAKMLERLGKKQFEQIIGDLHRLVGS